MGMWSPRGCRWIGVCVTLQANHLSHWGINMMGMEKTEKSMAELQIDLNMSYEFDKITESGSALHPLSGPGYDPPPPPPLVDQLDSLS